LWKRPGAVRCNEGLGDVLACTKESAPKSGEGDRNGVVAEKHVRGPALSEVYLGAAVA